MLNLRVLKVPQQKLWLRKAIQFAFYSVCVGINHLQTKATAKIGFIHDF